MIQLHWRYLHPLFQISRLQADLAIQTITLAPRAPFKSTSLNSDLPSPPIPNGPSPQSRSRLNPRDVMQVMFLLEQQPGEESEQNDGKDGRYLFGQLSITWRTAMGGRGFLSTGTLGMRRR